MSFIKDYLNKLYYKYCDHDWYYGKKYIYEGSLMVITKREVNYRKCKKCGKFEEI